MKTFAFLSSRVSLLFKSGICFALLLLVMPACNHQESHSKVTPAPPPDPSDPIEGLADDMMQDPTFLAILEQQAWMNNQVEQYLFTASETERTAAVSIIQSWQEKAHDFRMEDWNIARKVLGFPDLESFEQYQAEMGQRLEAFAESYSDIRLSPREAERLAGYLADRVLTDFPKPKGFESLEELEFRIADCCCAATNECSRTQCFRYDQCADNVWTLYFAEIGTGASVGAIGGFPGAALGVSAAVIFGGVHVGHQLNECWETYIRDCQAICNCQ